MTANILARLWAAVGSKASAHRRCREGEEREEVFVGRVKQARYADRRANATVARHLTETRLDGSWSHVTATRARV
jgi:hypothetical protein